MESDPRVYLQTFLREVSTPVTTFEEREQISRRCDEAVDGYLSASGAVNDQDFTGPLKGLTFLLVATAFGYSSVVEKLLSHGADPFLGFDGQTPALCSITVFSSRFIETLCSILKDTEGLAESKRDHVPFHIPFTEDHLRCFRHLLVNGVSGVFSSSHMIQFFTANLLHPLGQQYCDLLDIITINHDRRLQPNEHYLVFNFLRRPTHFDESVTPLFDSIFDRLIKLEPQPKHKLIYLLRACNPNPKVIEKVINEGKDKGFPPLPIGEFYHYSFPFNENTIEITKLFLKADLLSQTHFRHIILYAINFSHYDLYFPGIECTEVETDTSKFFPNVKSSFPSAPLAPSVIDGLTEFTPPLITELVKKQPVTTVPATTPTDNDTATGAPAGTDTATGAPAGTDTATGADTAVDTEANATVDTATGADTPAGTDANTDADTPASTDANTEANATVDAAVDTEANATVDTHADVDADTTTTTTTSSTPSVPEINYNNPCEVFGLLRKPAIVDHDIFIQLFKLIASRFQPQPNMKVGCTGFIGALIVPNIIKSYYYSVESKIAVIEFLLSNRVTNVLLFYDALHIDIMKAQAMILAPLTDSPERFRLATLLDFAFNCRTPVEDRPSVVEKISVLLCEIIYHYPYHYDLASFSKMIDEWCKFYAPDVPTDEIMMEVFPLFLKAVEKESEPNQGAQVTSAMNPHLLDQIMMSRPCKSKQNDLARPVIGEGVIINRIIFALQYFFHTFFLKDEPNITYDSVIAALKFSFGSLSKDATPLFPFKRAEPVPDEHILKFTPGSRAEANYKQSIQLINGDWSKVMTLPLNLISRYGYINNCAIAIDWLLQFSSFLSPFCDPIDVSPNAIVVSHEEATTPSTTTPSTTTTTTTTTSTTTTTTTTTTGGKSDKDKKDDKGKKDDEDENDDDDKDNKDGKQKSIVSGLHQLCNLMTNLCKDLTEWVRSCDKYLSECTFTILRGVFSFTAIVPFIDAHLPKERPVVDSERLLYAILRYIYNYLAPGDVENYPYTTPSKSLLRLQEFFQYIRETHFLLPSPYNKLFLALDVVQMFEQKSTDAFYSAFLMIASELSLTHHYDPITLKPCNRLLRSIELQDSEYDDIPIILRALVTDKKCGSPLTLAYAVDEEKLTQYLTKRLYNPSEYYSQITLKFIYRSGPHKIDMDPYDPTNICVLFYIVILHRLSHEQTTPITSRDNQLLRRIIAFIKKTLTKENKIDVELGVFAAQVKRSLVSFSRSAFGDESIEFIHLVFDNDLIPLSLRQQTYYKPLSHPNLKDTLITNNHDLLYHLITLCWSSIPWQGYNPFAISPFGVNYNDTSTPQVFPYHEGRMRYIQDIADYVNRRTGNVDYLSPALYMIFAYCQNVQYQEFATLRFLLKNLTIPYVPLRTILAFSQYSSSTGTPPIYTIYSRQLLQMIVSLFNVSADGSQPGQLVKITGDLPAITDFHGLTTSDDEITKYSISSFFKPISIRSNSLVEPGFVHRSLIDIIYLFLAVGFPTFDPNIASAVKKGTKQIKAETVQVIIDDLLFSLFETDKNKIFNDLYERLRVAYFFYTEKSHTTAYPSFFSTERLAQTLTFGALYPSVAVALQYFPSDEVPKAFYLDDSSRLAQSMSLQDLIKVINDTKREQVDIPSSANNDEVHDEFAVPTFDDDGDDENNLIDWESLHNIPFNDSTGSPHKNLIWYILKTVALPSVDDITTILSESTKSDGSLCFNIEECNDKQESILMHAILRRWNENALLAILNTMTPEFVVKHRDSDGLSVLDYVNRTSIDLDAPDVANKIKNMFG